MIRALCQQNRVYLLLLLLLVSVSCSSNVRREMEDAVAAGEASDVEDLIVQGADPNRVYGGKSLLLRAAELGHTGATQALVAGAPTWPGRTRTARRP